MMRRNRCTKDRKGTNRPKEDGRSSVGLCVYCFYLSLLFNSITVLLMNLMHSVT
jgi:hypothetical protein